MFFIAKRGGLKVEGGRYSSFVCGLSVVVFLLNLLQIIFAAKFHGLLFFTHMLFQGFIFTGVDAIEGFSYWAHFFCRGRGLRVGERLSDGGFVGAGRNTLRAPELQQGHNPQGLEHEDQEDRLRPSGSHGRGLPA